VALPLQALRDIPDSPVDGGRRHQRRRRPKKDRRTCGRALGLTGVIRFLHANKVDLTRKDSRGLTPLQTALGQAGGFGFGGRTQDDDDPNK
jgi:hypothetical protein